MTAPVDQPSSGELVTPALWPRTTGWAASAVGDTRVAVYAADDPAGFGPALQIVTDHSAMLMDSVTVLLHRLGVAYTAIMNPVFRVRRGPAGNCSRSRRRRCRRAAATASTRPGSTSSWRRRPTARPLAEAAALLPDVLADARQVALDSGALNATLVRLADELDADRRPAFPGSDRRDVAALLRWLADGHFVLLGYQRCAVSDGQASVDPASRLGVLRLRTDVLPQLTDTTTCWCWRRPRCRASCATARTRTSWWSARQCGRATARRSSTASSACSPSRR